MNDVLLLLCGVACYPGIVDECCRNTAATATTIAATAAVAVVVDVIEQYVDIQLQQ